jgi:hypothetical protein
LTLFGSGITVDQSATNNGAGGTATSLVFPNTSAASANGYVLRVGSWKASGTTLVRIDVPASHTERIDTNVQSTTDSSGDAAITSGSSRVLYLAENTITSGSTPGTATGNTNPSTAGNWAVGTVVFVETVSGPTVTNFSGGSGADTSAKVMAILSGTTTTSDSVNAIFATNSGLSTGVVTGSTTNPDSELRVALPVTGLTPDTTYFYGIQVNGTTISGGRGKLTTNPRPGTAASYTFTAVSCTHGALTCGTQMAAEDPRFHVWTGDKWRREPSRVSVIPISAYTPHSSKRRRPR